MEEIKQDQLSSMTELELDSEATSHLVETSKWAKFIAVFMFSLAGIIILAFFLGAGSYLTGQVGYLGLNSSSLLAGIFIVILVVIVVMGIIFYFLLNFANKVRSGLETEDIEKVNTGLNSLRIYLVIATVFSALYVIIDLFKLF